MVDSSTLEGPMLGQKPPGEVPVVFAPEIVSTGHLEHSAVAFSPDGNEVFWSLWRRPDQGLPQVIYTSQCDGDSWSRPDVTPFSGSYNDGGPVFSPDGKRLYFNSNRPASSDGQERGQGDIWFVDKQDGRCGNPQCVGLVRDYPEIGYAVQPSVTRDGSLYFLGHTETGTTNGFGIYVSRFEHGRFTRPQLLGPQINQTGALNWTPFVDPNDRYLIFSSNRPGGHDGIGDLYLCRRQADGSWGHPVPLPDSVNTDRQERFPAVSPDGKYLFFTRWTPERNQDIFWVDVHVLDAVLKDIKMSH